LLVDKARGPLAAAMTVDNRTKFRPSEGCYSEIGEDIHHHLPSCKAIVAAARRLAGNGAASSLRSDVFGYLAAVLLIDQTREHT
jgi:hypothetical protein